MISTTEERKKPRSGRRADDDVDNRKQEKPRSGRRVDDEESNRGQEKPRSGRKAVQKVTEPPTFVTETHTMAQYQDTDGKLDLENAPALIVVDKGLEMQEKSKQAMLRVNDELFQTEQVAIWTKEELQKQNAKLMVIDE